MISMIEFGLWILDELKDRSCGEMVCGWLRRRKRRMDLTADIELGKEDSVQM